MKLPRLLVACLALLLATQVFAGEKKPFSRAEFEALQAANKPVLVDVFATWCSTCKAQAPIISSMLTKPEFKDLTVLEVDFDQSKDVLRQFNVVAQSTLVLFKGKKEVARSTGDTHEGSVRAMLLRAI